MYKQKKNDNKREKQMEIARGRQKIKTCFCLNRVPHYEDVWERESIWNDAMDDDNSNNQQV